MAYIKALLSDPVLWAVVGLLGFGLVLALLRIPKDPVSRKQVMYTLWLVCMMVLGSWAMWLQSAVLSGGHLPSSYDTVAVPIKGTVRYVPQDLAYRYDASMLVLLLSMLAYFGIARIARVGDEA